MSDGGTSKNTGVSVKIGLAKETDKAVAGILTSLLKPGATELGNLFGDSVGMIADLVRAKREQNAKIGFEQVREKLESASINLAEITPPKGEELHLLITGLSLSDDENVRDLWSGLFAKAIEPNSKITAERSYISVLQSLSPLDAKIIDLIALAMRLDRKIGVQQQKLVQRQFKPPTAKMKAAHDAAQSELLEHCQAGIKHIQEAAERHGLTNLKGQNWLGNLKRQGIIERTPILGMSPSGFRARSIDDLEKKVATLDELARWSSTDPEEMFFSYGLTPHLFMHRGADSLLTVQFTKFGQQLAEACGLL